NPAAPPITVNLGTEGGRLYLGRFKERLGRLGVEKTPMEFYNRRRKHWEPFTWDGGIEIRGKTEVAIKERGLEVTL
ncbi:hypothetical protein V5O48_019634, partial [Marasmius crinis-equi]